MSKNQTRTKKEDIIKFWIGKIDETELNFDWCDGDIVCWNCGCKRKTQRCHIVPFSLDGEDEPHNYVLLCNICHQNAPNCSNERTMWDWIKSNKTKYGITDCYFIEKGFDEYERIYKKDLINELTSIGITDTNIRDNLQEYNKTNPISTHFSDSHFNPSSTAGYIDGFLNHKISLKDSFIKPYAQEYESKLKKWEKSIKK